MGEIVAEQRGGAIGAGAGVKTQSRLPLASLSDADRAKLDSLFRAKKPVSGNLFYRLTRTGPGGQDQVDAEPNDVPRPLIDNLKTTLE